MKRHALICDPPLTVHTVRLLVRVPWRRRTGSSTYKDSYPQHPICPHHGPVALQWAPAPIPFVGTSEARAQYTPKAIDPTVFAGTGSTGEAPPRSKIPFEGQSSYKSDYVPHQLCPIHAPPEGAAAYRPTNIPFEGVSSSHDAYKKWDLPARPTYDGAGAAPPRAHIPFEVRTVARSVSCVVSQV